MTTIVFVILILISISSLIWSAAMFRRNNQVYNYRYKLLKKIADKADEDIENNRPWAWRYEVFESVQYDEMMNKFWRKLDSFYTDKSFIENDTLK